MKTSASEIERGVFFIKFIDQVTSAVTSIEHILSINYYQLISSLKFTKFDFFQGKSLYLRKKTPFAFVNISFTLFVSISFKNRYLRKCYFLIKLKLIRLMNFRP